MKKVIYPMADTLFLQCVIVTPEKAVLDETADLVVVPMYDGELGIAPSRVPLIGRLGIGELRLSKGNRTKHYYIDGGFVQLRNNVVTILTHGAVPAADINTHEARIALATPPVGATPEAQDAQRQAQERHRPSCELPKKSRIKPGDRHCIIPAGSFSVHHAFACCGVARPELAKGVMRPVAYNA